jgi:hypothetical protein
MKNLLLLAIIIIVFSSCRDLRNSQSRQIDSLKIGLLAYYPFNNNAVDQSGHNYNGVLNGVASVEDRNGNANSAYYFNGVNSNIAISKKFYALKLHNTDFSINAWVKLDGYSTFNGYVIISKRADQSEDGFDFSITGTGYSGGVPGIITFGPGGPYNNEWGKTQIDPAKWYMVTIVYSYANKKIRSYINGVLDNESDANIISPNSDSTLYIGSDNPDKYTPYYFKGDIDDFRIYDRILTINDLNKLYIKKD